MQKGWQVNESREMYNVCSLESRGFIENLRELCLRPPPSRRDAGPCESCFLGTSTGVDLGDDAASPLALGALALLSSSSISREKVEHSGRRFAGVEKAWGTPMRVSKPG